MPKSILIAEDDPYLLNLYSKALRKSGFNVSGSQTLQHVREQLEAEPFDLLLCDIHLDDGSVIDYLQEIPDQEMEIIVASGDAHYRTVCEELGIDFYLEKPISIKVMITLIQRLLN
jgi:DNA-binding NtrC family response regulator